MHLTVLTTSQTTLTPQCWLRCCVHLTVLTTSQTTLTPQCWLRCCVHLTVLTTSQTTLTPQCWLRCCVHLTVLTTSQTTLTPKCWMYFPNGGWDYSDVAMPLNWHGRPEQVNRKHPTVRLDGEVYGRCWPNC